MVRKLLANPPTPKLYNHPLLVVRNCLFNIFTATFNAEGCSYIRNLRKHHAVDDRDPLHRASSQLLLCIRLEICV